MFPRYAIEAWNDWTSESILFFNINGTNSQDILTLIGSLALAKGFASSSANLSGISSIKFDQCRFKKST